VTWFSSIPEAYKQEIKDHLKNEKLTFDEDHTYQVVVNLPKLRQKPLVFPENLARPI